jgi:hypothetical protein
MIWEIIV